MTARARYFSASDFVLNCLCHSGHCPYGKKRSFRSRKAMVAVSPTPGVVIVQVETPNRSSLLFCLLYAVANDALQPRSGVTFLQNRGVFYVGDSGDLRTKYFYSTSMALRRILWP
jgi:hypothetical protein